MVGRYLISLYLIAAHFVGDYLLQSRWQAARKLTHAGVRFRHVCLYSLPFVPIAVVYAHHRWPASSVHQTWGVFDFMLLLFVLHFLTDSRRFRSSPGDVLGWTWKRLRDPGFAAVSWINYLYGVEAAGVEPLAWRLDKVQNIDAGTLRWPPPNPWAPMPLLIDQSLHLAQIAILGAVFLR